MRQELILSGILFILLIFGCDRNFSTNPHSRKGKIEVSIRIGENRLRPRHTVPIKVEFINPKSNNTVIIDTIATDYYGNIKIDNLDYGSYIFTFETNDKYSARKNPNDVNYLSKIATIDKNNQTEKTSLNLWGWYHISRDTISMDLDEPNYFGSSISAFCFNDGIRDTLNWHIDTTFVPSWLHVSIKEGIFPPNGTSYTTDTFLAFAIYKETFPISQSGKVVKVPIAHQFSVDTINVLINIKY
jgi:hypothetical protein